MTAGFDVVEKVLSKPYTVSPRSSFADHGTYTKDSCPVSTRRRRDHYGHAVLRQTLTKTFRNGTKSTSYVDHVTCQFCGHEWKAEWMPAGI